MTVLATYDYLYCYPGAGTSLNPTREVVEEGVVVVINSREININNNNSLSHKVMMRILAEVGDFRHIPEFPNGDTRLY